MHATAVKILDERKWATRLFWADLLALGLFLVVGVGLFVEMYYLGWTAYAAAASTNAEFVASRDVRAVRMMFEAGIVSISFAWLAYRVVRGGYLGIADAGR